MCLLSAIPNFRNMFYFSRLKKQLIQIMTSLVNLNDESWDLERIVI